MSGKFGKPCKVTQVLNMKGFFSLVNAEFQGASKKSLSVMSAQLRFISFRRKAWPTETSQNFEFCLTCIRGKDTELNKSYTLICHGGIVTAKRGRNVDGENQTLL